MILRTNVTRSPVTGCCCVRGQCFTHRLWSFSHSCSSSLLCACSVLTALQVRHKTNQLGNRIYSCILIMLLLPSPFLTYCIWIKYLSYSCPLPIHTAGVGKISVRTITYGLVISIFLGSTSWYTHSTASAFLTSFAHSPSFCACSASLSARDTFICSFRNEAQQQLHDKLQLSPINLSYFFFYLYIRH